MGKLIDHTETGYQIPMYLDTDTPKTDQMVLGCDLDVTLLDGRIAYLPSGFITDFHSVPPIAWSVWKPYHSRTNLAAMTHDYLYEQWESHVLNHPELGELSETDARAYADRMFLGLMDQFSPTTMRRNKLYYRGVRLFGGANFSRFRQEASLDPEPITI